MFDEIEQIHRMQVYALVLGSLAVAWCGAVAIATWAVLKYGAVA